MTASGVKPGPRTKLNFPGDGTARKSLAGTPFQYLKTPGRTLVSMLTLRADSSFLRRGEVAEWPKALDSKSSKRQKRFVSSNLTLSAN